MYAWRVLLADDCSICRPARAPGLALWARTCSLRFGCGTTGLHVRWSRGLKIHDGGYRFGLVNPAGQYFFRRLEMKRCLASCFVVVALVGGGSVFAQSKAKAENVPEIAYDAVPNFFKLPPDVYFGEG